MILRTLFTINLPIALFYGLGCSLFPAVGLQIYGLPTDDAAIWVTRLVGGSILGFATLMWFGRKSASAEAQSAIALALLIQDIVGFAASLEIQLSGSANVVGWSNPVTYGALAVAYAYSLFFRAADIQPWLS